MWYLASLRLATEDTTKLRLRRVFGHNCAKAPRLDAVGKDSGYDEKSGESH